MAHQSVGQSLLRLARSFKKLDVSDPLAQCLAPRLNRGFATETTIPLQELVDEIDVPDSEMSNSAPTSQNPDLLSQTMPTSHTTSATSSRVLTSLHSWPSLEPQGFAWYSAKYLDMPLRRDLLHRAVIYEGDATRQGTASTRWRGDVHGSNRKILQQKGSGRARAGDKKSPIRRGGGVAFGPHPRDFSTELQRKVYDIAWRTALSYRYRKGELVILSNHVTMPESATGRFLANFFEKNRWGKGYGRSLIVTNAVRPSLYEAMGTVGEHGLVKDVTDVDVKDLLETGRIVIEQTALNNLLGSHSADLGSEFRTDPEFAWHLDEQDGSLKFRGRDRELLQ